MPVWVAGDPDRALDVVGPIARASGAVVLGCSDGNADIGVAWVAPGGEALTRLGQSIRAQRAAQHSMLLGLTDDTAGHLVPQDGWLTGRDDNYEERVSLGRQAAGIISDAVTSLVHATE